MRYTPGMPSPNLSSLSDAGSLSTPQKLYLWLASISVTSLLVADFMGVRLFRIPLGFSFHVPWQDAPIDAIQHTCGMLTFPITFLLTDLINEYYGKKAARRVVWLGFAMGGLSFLVMNVSLWMPYWDVPFNVPNKSFEDVFANSRVMYIASLAAFLVGNLLDVRMFAWIKRLTGDRFVWLRATGSTIISQFIDSFIVTWLAFSVGRALFPTDAAAMPFDEVLKTAATGYMLKFVIAIASTPVIYLGRWFIHTKMGMKPVSIQGS